MTRPYSSRYARLTFVLAAVLLSAVSSGAQEPGEVAEDDYFLFGTGLDFGDLNDQQPHPDTLWMRNPTATALVVENVRTSCGCTVADWPEAPVAPGARFAIPLAFRCRRAGYTEKSVEIWVTGRRRGLRATVVADCVGPDER